MRELDGEQLKEMLEQHRLWLDGDPNGKLADFRNCIISEANFVEARLEGAMFEKAQLTRCRFKYAHLEKASFVEAKIAGCSFHGAFCRASDFSGAEVNTCTFNMADLNHANFWNVKADRVEFECTQIHKAVFDYASMKHALFCGAVATEACFEWADVQGANLEDANFKNAKMTGANLHLARLKNANFSGAELYNAAWPLGRSSIGAKVDVETVKHFLAHIVGVQVEESEQEEFFKIFNTIKEFAQNSKRSKKLHTDERIKYNEWVQALSKIEPENVDYDDLDLDSLEY